MAQDGRVDALHIQILIFTPDKHNLLSYVSAAAADVIHWKTLQKVAEESCQSVKRRRNYSSTFLRTGFFELPVETKLQVFGLYPTQTTTPLHTSKCVSGETELGAGALRPCEETNAESTFAGHTKPDLRLSEVPVCLPLQVFTSWITGCGCGYKEAASSCFLTCRRLSLHQCVHQLFLYESIMETSCFARLFLRSYFPAFTL